MKYNFKIGDIVKCINSGSSYYSLTYGKLYKVCSIDGVCIYILDDSNQINFFHITRFILDVATLRNGIINEILS